jgi:Pvc16 N-terminal domain
MSNALAIAGVTAVLQHYLHNLYVSVGSNFSSPVHVSCLAPDQIQQQIVSGSTTTENQVNLFLHLVTPNSAWRNVGYASLDPSGTKAIGNPPLALDLHYLLTAYGSGPWQAEALLGFALMMLHQAPVLTRADVDAALAARAGSSYPYSGYPLNATIGLCGIGDQAELLKITPESMSREEMAWLWTALKADYRPTYPFQVSVALLQPEQASSFALPVLKTVFSAAATPPPTILSIQTKSGQPAGQQGESVTLTGEFLAGANQVLLTHAKLGRQLKLTPSGVTANSVTFQLPTSPPNQYPAGIYDLVVQWLDTSGNAQQSTNTVAFAVATWLPATQAAPTAAVGSQMQLTLNSFAPQIWPGQAVTLALSNTAVPLVSLSAEAQPLPDQNPASSLTFLFSNGLPTGTNLLARLEVDGVSSIVQANIPISGSPSFIGPWVTI